MAEKQAFQLQSLGIWKPVKISLPNSNHKALRHKNQILKCLWEWLSSLPHSRPPEHSHFTVETGKTAYTFEKQCTYSN